MLTCLIVELLNNLQTPVISTKSLIEQRFDLTHAPTPKFTMRQASSYSRKSVVAGNEDWFANDDYGHYLRQEGKEYVMADLKGPGAVVRIWSANPMGTLRFYFDGETEARITTNMKEWVDDLRLRMPEVGKNLAFWADRGWNVYLPLPYSKSLKVTMEPGAKDNPKGLYYHVGYRTYDSKTNVKSFQASDITDRYKNLPSSTAFTTQKTYTLSPTKKIETIRFKGQGTIREIMVPWGGKDFQQSLRSIWVTAMFDGEKTVSAPLGDFLAAPFGQKHKSGPETNRDVVLSFDMPFMREAVFTFERNTLYKGEPVNLRFSSDKRKVVYPYYFHCDFSRDRGRTRPMRDMHWLDATGQGYLAGCHLLVSNSAKGWWGEGDEKIFVDGEAFPSFFGTGTEDFLNYAWSSPIPYWTPVGAQSYTTTTANGYGYCSITRMMNLDPIPFTKSIKFDLEMWHWIDCQATWDRTVYWYAKAGANVTRQQRPSWKDLEVPDYPEAPRYPGAIEGEKLKYSKTGGVAEIQGGFGDMSGDNQIWWRNVPIGAQLTVEVPAKDGEYELTINACRARDYGIHQLYWNGEKLGQPIDFYDEGLAWKQVKLGRVKVTGGKAILSAECVGTNPKADPKNMFGLDYVLLKAVK